MAKKPKIIEEPTELEPGEEYISRDDLEIMFAAIEEDDGIPAVWVRFTNFEDMEEAQDYADFLEETLPLLLFHSTTKH